MNKITFLYFYTNIQKIKYHSLRIKSSYICTLQIHVFVGRLQYKFPPIYSCHIRGEHISLHCGYRVSHTRCFYLRFLEERKAILGKIQTLLTSDEYLNPQTKLLAGFPFFFLKPSILLKVQLIRSDNIFSKMSLGAKLTKNTFCKSF